MRRLRIRDALTGTVGMYSVPEPDTLAGMSLFQGLPPDQLATLAKQLRRRTFSAGASVLTAEQPGEAAYVIVRGTVKVHREQADGRNVILAILGPGQVLGELSLADSLGRSASVVTLEESELLWMGRAAFERAMGTVPRLSLNLVRVLSGRLRLADAQIQALASLDVHGRVARQILVFAQEYGQPVQGGGVHIPLHLTQADLADLVGASRVRVNQVLVDYREWGYIVTDARHRITVLNQKALAGRCA